MRITNRMMTTNMLNNVERNKKNESKLGDQYSTKQKIQRPSDDPVIAVRSLKYRTQLTEIIQYLDKNIPDAAAWMDMTESAMVSASDVLLKDMVTYCTNGANDTLESGDRDSIIQSLTEYKNQFVQLANTDYAGRYVFTGYRTDTPLIIDKTGLEKINANQTLYHITENLNFSNINSKSYVEGGAIYEAGTSANDYAQSAPTMKNASIISLSYSNLDRGPALDRETSMGDVFTSDSGIQGIRLKDSLGNIIEIPDSGGEYTLTTKSLSDTAQGEPYTAGDNEVIFIPETGELVFGAAVYATAQKYPNISIDYTKSKFEEGDILPEHYFECTKSSIVVDSSVTATGTYKDEVIYYSEPGVQKIDYEINFSQKLTVNTLAKDAFSTSVVTQLDQLIRNVNSVFDMDNKIKEVDKLLATTTDEKELANLKELKSQLETEQTLKKTILRETFAGSITTFKDSQQILNNALANHGSRQLRLELTEGRLETQKTEFTEILSNNDGVDFEEAIINFKQAQVIYEASLSCAATVISKTLLDYL